MAPINIDPDNLLVMVQKIQATANQFDQEMNAQVKAVEALPNFSGAAATAYQSTMNQAGAQFKGVVGMINGLAETLRRLGDGMTQTDAALAKIAGGAGSDVSL